MKKIISSITILALFFIACKDKKDAMSPQNVQPSVVEVVVGIGKVLPEGGLVTLTVEQPSKVIKVYTRLGDTINVGEKLFDMEAVNQELQVAQSKSRLDGARETLKANAYDVKLAQIKLAALKKEFEVSSKLKLSQAETPQKVFQDSIAYMEQLTTVRKLQQEVKAQQISLASNELDLKTSQQAVNDKSYKAMQSGVVLNFDVVLGQILQPNTPYGQIAPLKMLVVEAELDEVYANKIKVGQEVDLYLVGQNKGIASGTISLVGTGLQNKSIIYETVGEGTDRRVRRFTVNISKGQENLLINQKVECKIKL